MTDDETTARNQLGLWLSAEPGRTWDCERDVGSPDLLVSLWKDGRFLFRGTGPTLAAAIIDALGKV